MWRLRCAVPNAHMAAGRGSKRGAARPVFPPRRGSFLKTAELRIYSLTSSNEHSGNVSVPMKTTQVDESQIALFVLFHILERAVKYIWP